MSRTGKSLKTISGFTVARGWGRRNGERLFHGSEASFLGVTRMFWNEIVLTHKITKA